MGNKLNIYSIFRIPIIRQLYTRLRYYFFNYTRNLRKAKDIQGVGWLEYSESAFQKWMPLTRRIDFLVSTLDINLEDKKSKLLVIGPRFECELFGYLALGIKKNNLKAIDTFSYSPLINCGNMHEMKEFPDKTFNLIIVGWTIVYAKNPSQVFEELIRVTDSSGKIILTWDSPREIQYNDFEDLVFKNTEGTIFRISDLISRENILSWAITRPSYNQNSQVITLVMQR